MKIHLKKKKKLNHSEDNREMGGNGGLRLREDSVGVGLIGVREVGLRQMGLNSRKPKQWSDRRWVSVEMEDWAEVWVEDVDRRLGAWVGLGQ